MIAALWWACAAATPTAPPSPAPLPPAPPVAWVADDGHVTALTPLVDVHADQPAIWPFDVPVGHRGALHATGAAVPRPLVAATHGERCWVALGPPPAPESPGRWRLSPGRWAILAPGDARAALLDVGGPVGLPCP